MRSIRVFQIIAAYCVLVFALAGCGGGGGAISTPADVQEGSFIDSPVCGLQYETLRWSGITTQDGTFNFQPGETVTFSIGNVVLGSTQAKRFVTPIDLVPGATDLRDLSAENIPVVNICRFLQSLDEDNDPENGITITPETRDFLQGFSVNFTDPEFEQNPEVQRLFEELNLQCIFEEERFLVPEESAIIHFEETLIEIEGILAEEANQPLLAIIEKPQWNVLLILGLGQSIHLEGKATGGTPPYSYAWNVGDETNFSLAEDPGLISFYNTGNFPVVFTVTDAENATASDYGLVTVIDGEEYGPIPSKDEHAEARFVNAGNVIRVPLHQEVRLKAEIIRGNPPFHYFWSYPEAAIFSPSTNPLEAFFRFRSTGRYLISFTVVDSWNQDDWTCSVMVIVESPSANAPEG